MANPVGITELSRRLGRTERTLRNLATAGKIPRNADGSFDESAVRKVFAKRTGAYRTKPLLPPASAKPPPVETLSDARAALSMIRQVLRDEGRAVSGGLTYDDLRAAESIVRTRDREQKMRQRRGELVDRAQAVNAVFALARQERDAWQSWPSRISALMAARLGVDAHKLESDLDSEVKAHLSALGAVDAAHAITAPARH
jgi:hypothetical protein